MPGTEGDCWTGPAASTPGSDRGEAPEGRRVGYANSPGRAESWIRVKSTREIQGVDKITETPPNVFNIVKYREM